MRCIYGDEGRGGFPVARESRPASGTCADATGSRWGAARGELAPSPASVGTTRQVHPPQLREVEKVTHDDRDVGL